MYHTRYKHGIVCWLYLNKKGKKAQESWPKCWRNYSRQLHNSGRVWYTRNLKHSAQTLITSAAPPAANQTVLCEQGDGRSNLFPFPVSSTGKHPWSVVAHKMIEPRHQFHMTSYQKFKVFFPKNKMGSRTTHLRSSPLQHPLQWMPLGGCWTCQRC